MRIVFVERQVGTRNEYVTNLWMVETSGAERRQFTEGGKDSASHWSPDGAHRVRSGEGQSAAADPHHRAAGLRLAAAGDGFRRSIEIDNNRCSVA